MSVPTLDHQMFMKGNAKQRSEYAEQLVASLKSHGFVKIINHGIDKLTIDELFTRTKDFFTLPRDTQKVVQHQASDNPQRGWSSIGMEQTSHLYGRNSDRPDGEHKDCKEHYDIGPPYDTQFPNQWLPDSELPGWRAFMENYWQQCQMVAMSLISAIELGLSIPAGTIAARCLPSASEVRLNHYPAISSKELADGSTARIWPHTDFGIITLLITDSVGGLEIEDPCSPGAFLPVSQGPRSEMIVNAADTLQRWTNGVLKAGLHRVMLPPGVKGEDDEMIEERWSIPYLFKARREARVGALQEFVSEKRRSKYEDITALEFQLRRQHQVYSDKQLLVV